jgi:hypothetical protein
LPVESLGGSPLTILLFLLIVLRWILPAGVNIPLLLLASLPGLSSLSALLTLAVLALLALPLALLATLLLILFHIVCHVYSSIFAERILPRRRGIVIQHLFCLPTLVAMYPRQVGNYLSLFPSDESEVILYFISFTSSTSHFSITGAFASKVAAFAINPAATRPFKCACLPASSLNTSKIPKVDGPILIANHSRVSGSSSTIACALRKKLSTSISLPGFASTRASKANLIFAIFTLLHS